MRQFLASELPRLSQASILSPCGSSKSLRLCQKHPSCDMHTQISALLSQQSRIIKINPDGDLSPSGSMNISISGYISYREDTWCLRTKKLFLNNSVKSERGKKRCQFLKKKLETYKKHSFIRFIEYSNNARSVESNAVPHPFPSQFYSPDLTTESFLSSCREKYVYFCK